ncbi:MAG: hypothetical protein CMQ52_03380 [Gammaproteobacteria bacterium]|nr:hypothetical protein [Gammaproteobacteria bacterium]MDG1509635.1 DUF6122 family protein [Flavobacteriaceae bacterium]MDG2274556.1 DUF6122 family protein [Flavobacteriaceae bacterium]
MSFKFFVHYGFHFLVPLAISILFYKKKWKLAYLIFIGTMLIDLDHLLANPIFDANRCSINFHPLHSYYAIGVYIIMLIPKKTRILGIALLLHMFTDYLDCFL